MTKTNINPSISLIADYDGDIRSIFDIQYDSVIPILPLRNMVLFPGIVIPVSVERPFSLELIKKVKDWKIKQFGNDAAIGSLPIAVEPNTHVYNDTYNNFFRRYQKKYGVKENLSIHKIRHSYISFLLSQGIGAETIAPQVGHSDTTMITQVYGHLLKEQRDIDNLRIASLMR